MRIKNCRNCKNPKFIKLFSLGNQSFTGKFTPKKIKVKKGFLDLIMCSKCNLIQLAHNYDLNSAMELMGNWKERSLITNTAKAEEQKALKRSEALRTGKAVSGGSSDSTAGKKIYRRADLIRLRNSDPDRYESLQDEILQAYSDGRVK